MTFRVGQKVVCVDASGIVYASNAPKEGGVYTIRWIGQRETDSKLSVMLDEVFAGMHPHFDVEYSFNARRFRPIVARKTDISFAHAILRSASQKVRA